MELKMSGVAWMCIVVSLLCGCSDFGPDDGSAQWLIYDFDGAMTIELPSYFGAPNYPLIDADGVGFKTDGMVLYIQRGVYLSYPAWAIGMHQYAASPLTVDGWEATLFTFVGASSSGQYFFIEAWFHDVDTNHKRYTVFAECKTLEMQKLAKHMISTIHFKVQKGT
jgi:hypothetical protein